MADIAFDRFGKKHNQGMVFSGILPSTGYQTQFWAPIQPKYAGMPNGRIVSLNAQGEFVPGVKTTGNFVMSFLLQHGGSYVDRVPQSYFNGAAGTGEFPNVNAFPTDTPNVFGLPLCVGYEYMTTEFDMQEAQSFIPGATPLTARTTGVGKEWGKATTASSSDVVIGIVSRRPGFGRPRYTNGINAFGASLPGGYNQQVAVTGNNAPALMFWGYPFPKGDYFGTPAAATGPDA
jgi:hypothetical protein